jgi:VWFA-related protein
VRQARAVAQAFAKQEENLSRYTLNSFASIASYLQMDHLDGRLVMVYVSGGFPLHPGQNYFQIIDRALEDSNEFGSNELGFREHPDYDFDKEVRRMVGYLNRLNVTIYSVDCAGLTENDNNGPDRTTQQLRYGADTVAYQKELQDSLYIVSEETGGLTFANSQNFAKGLAEISTDLGDEYWLCSNLPPSEKSGSYHKIEVKVARSDLKVRYRKGYYE